MKLMSPKYNCTAALSTLFVLLLAMTFDVAAQTNRSSAKTKPATGKASEKKATDKKVADKKTDSQAKNSQKQVPDKQAKNSRKQGPEKATAAEKKKAADKAREVASDKKKDNSRHQSTAKVENNRKSEKRESESKRAAAAERRREEQERRQAELAERRRREQAAREARARQLAFERGLRTETVANIAKDNSEGEDLQIRNVAISALGSHAGSVVVMEAQTGKVLTIVNQDWAVRDSVKPCSTIKLVTGVAGINEGVISKADGSIRNQPSRRDLDDALAYSDNPYFQRAGAIVGNPKMVDYARQLGLGQPTGLNTEGETAGKLAIGNHNPRIYSHGDDFEVSTLQLAVMVSAITNGGLRVIPRVPRNEIEKTKFQTFYRQKVEMSKQNLRRVIPGMIGAAEYGTARRDMDMSLGVAGKTGSCISKGTWVGLFASVAPIEDPKYSVVVITRGQSERGRHAAAVASKIYRALSRQIVRTDRNLAQTEFKLQPRFPVTSAIANVSAEEEDDDISEGKAGTVAESQPGNSVNEASTSPNVSPIILVPVAKPDAKKLVNKTVNAKPVFPPVVITYERDDKNKSGRIVNP